MDGSGCARQHVDGLRGRLGELPRGRRIVVHCAAGVRSHAAVRILRLHGLDAHNLSGGFRSFRNLQDVPQPHRP
jgi:rhodanese-related sulfurtransferase